MKTSTKKVEKKGVEKKELKEAFVLWKHAAKSEKEYLTGFINDPKGIDDLRLVGFFNTNKKNAKEPDIRIYLVNEDGKRDSEVCSLWENVSKNEKQYLTGLTDEKEKIIAFYSDSVNDKRPYIRAYYKED